MPRADTSKPALLACLLALGAGSAVAQQQSPEAGPSFEASLKKFCPTRNLEFLPADTLAEATDAFVEQLPPDVRKQEQTLSQPGVEACKGSADDSCRTAAVLGTLRYMNLSEPLAQRFCGMAMTCTDWFQCSPDDAAAPGRQARADSADEAPAAEDPQGPPRLQPPVQPSGPLPAPAVPDDVEGRADLAPGQGARARTAPPRRSPEVSTPAVSYAPPATPEQAVQGFYGALGRRDGITAASFLIPPKRGRGNYSAAAMQRFYGGLARPLVLREVRQIGPMTVSARYDFTTRDGAVCDGHSIVSLRASEEGVLISSIRALSNC